MFSDYIDPDYTAIEDIDRQTFQGDKRVSKSSKKAARALTRGPERTLRHEMIPVPPDVQVSSPQNVHLCTCVSIDALQEHLTFDIFSHIRVHGIRRVARTHECTSNLI
jgi:hypothetical protein